MSASENATERPENNMDSAHTRTHVTDDTSDADPRAIRSLAVTTADVVTAYEARQRSARRTVLRATPPFSGRMRARLHEPDGDAARERDADVEHSTGALHVPPSRFVAEDEIPAYPDPDDTEDALRSDPEIEFTVERHRERHVEAVAAWRDSVVKAIVDSLELRLSDGDHEVGVSTLGDSSE